MRRKNSASQTLRQAKTQIPQGVSAYNCRLNTSAGDPVCGARPSPCPQGLRRWSTTAQPAALLHLPPAAQGRLGRTLTCGSSPTSTKINPIVNVSFTMGFIGAGDRTRTGTLSPAVDFESTTSTNSITPARTLHSIHHSF